MRWITSFLLISILMTSCWKQQDISVEPPTDPTYSIFGAISWEDTGLPLRQAMIRLSMVEVYQGEFLDPVEAYTDSLGQYNFQGLYRGRYDVRVTKGFDWLYDGEVGIIQYEDKEYNLSLSYPEITPTP